MIDEITHKLTKLHNKGKKLIPKIKEDFTYFFQHQDIWASEPDPGSGIRVQVYPGPGSKIQDPDPVQDQRSGPRFKSSAYGKIEVAYGKYQENQAP